MGVPRYRRETAAHRDSTLPRGRPRPGCPVRCGNPTRSPAVRPGPLARGPCSLAPLPCPAPALPGDAGAAPAPSAPAVPFPPLRGGRVGGPAPGAPRRPARPGLSPSPPAQWVLPSSPRFLLRPPRPSAIPCPALRPPPLPRSPSSFSFLPLLPPTARMTVLRSRSASQPAGRRHAGPQPLTSGPPEPAAGSSRPAWPRPASGPAPACGRGAARGSQPRAPTRSPGPTWRLTLAWVDP